MSRRAKTPFDHLWLFADVLFNLLDNTWAHDHPIDKAHQAAAHQRAGCYNSAMLPIHLREAAR